MIAYLVLLTLGFLFLLFIKYRGYCGLVREYL